MNSRDEIADTLSSYRTKLRQSFNHPECRIALLQLLRCVDYGTFLNYIYDQAGRQQDDEEQIRQVSQLFGWGLNEALTVFWNDQVNQLGVPLFPSSQEDKNWGDALLQCSGRVRIIEHVLEMERIHLGTITRSPICPNTFDFQYAENATGVESVERQDSMHFNVLLARLHERDGVWKRLAERRAGIMAKMETMVSPWKQYYIGYDALPEVDDYYHDLASAIAPTRTGWDAFPLKASFGGIPFVRYIDCVRVLLGFALKHLDFCVLLCNRHSEIDPTNVVAVPCKWPDACGYMAYALNMSENEAEQIMLTTCLTPENACHHLKIPAGPIAPHYMIGHGSAVRLITGCLHNPFHFMLRELRRRFSSDWDSSVASREHVFRNDLIALLSRFNRLVCFTDNIDVSTTIGKTDVDALAFDPVSKIVGLFQLKWQEPFGGSMRERESRKTNFLHTGNAWIEKVSRWIDEGKMPQTLVSLGMPKSVANNIRETRLFVLGRSFSHFSGEFEIDSRAAWGSWPQLLRLVETEAKGKSPLTVLYDLIKADAPTTRAKRPIECETIKIDGLTLVTHPHK